MKRRQTAKEKELADQAKLTRAWRAFHREERDLALSGPYGAALNELFRMFANLRNVQPSQLIGYTRAINWLEIDYLTRLTVIHELNTAITAFREKRGLEPIDDNLPGDPDTPFRTIKMILLTPHCEGAHRGAARLEANVLHSTGEKHEYECYGAAIRWWLALRAVG